MPFDPVARIRRFNRAVTTEVGALNQSYLGRGRPLGAARVLSGISGTGTPVADIRARLRLDSGQMSRHLRKLEAEGLILTEPGPADRRRRIARLTDAGRAEKDAYDRQSDQLAAALLMRFSRGADSLLAAMDLVAVALDRDQILIRPCAPDQPEARACVAAYFAMLGQRIKDLSPEHIPAIDPEADAYRAPDGCFLVAWSDGLPIGCVAVKTAGPAMGEVKRLWIDASARGFGLGRRMLAAIEDTARDLGHTHLRLDTNAALTEAIGLYRATGWQDIAAFTPHGPATHWFGKRL